MRRVAAILLGVVMGSAAAAAENVRMEIGLGGVFPVGGWTRCRISGLEGVDDGAVISVNVAEMCESRMKVTGGSAEGLILMADEAASITISVPLRGRVELPPEQTRGLRGVKDVPAAIFVGEDAPDAAAAAKALDGAGLFPIVMSPGQFAERMGREIDWVRVFVLGRMSDDEVEQLRKHFAHLSGSVLVAKPEALRGWLRNLSFEPSGGLAVYNGDLAQFLPAPRGPVRPDLYEIFGPPKWPRVARRNVVLCFLGILVLFALAAVFRGKTRATRAYGRVLPATFAVLLTVMTAWRVSAPVESVALWEGADGSRLGVRTEILSTAVLKSGAGKSSKTDIAPVPEYVPVASRPEQWVEHRVVLDEENRLTWEAPAPSRRVFWSRVVIARPSEEPGRWIETDGGTVWPLPPRYGGGGQSFAEYLAERRHEDVRVEELRDGAMRWWLGGRPRGRAFRIGWTQADTDGAVLSAGTMVVIRTGALAAGVYPRGMKILRDDLDTFRPDE